MGYWTINGRQYNEAEYEEYKKEELKRWELEEAEAQRLIGVAAEAFTACDKYMEAHPRYPYGMKDDAQEREFKIYQSLRSNLGAADRAPRCEKVRENGTVCGSPQMKGYRYCYAHERTLQMQSQKLELPAQEDANGIQMAIMRVQKALIDDEISEKKARLLLYSLQLASSNLKHTTFALVGEKATVEMTEAPRGGTSRVKVANGNWQMANSQTTDEAAVSTQPSALSQSKGKGLPQMNADRRGSGNGKNRLTTHSTSLRAGTVTKEHKGKMNRGERLSQTRTRKADPSTALGTTSQGQQSAESVNAESLNAERHANLG